MQTENKNDRLPVTDLEKIGLYKDGKFLISQPDLAALLAGRRTDMLKIRDLKIGGLQIEQLDAKLSVTFDGGHPSLKIHPIYREPQIPSMLNEHEAAVLFDGQIDTLQKIYEKDGKRKMYAFEYDPETKEFISYDPEKIAVPEKINGEELTDEQKASFRNGEIITLGDGTQVQHRASERSGIKSDRSALVMSVLLDGGISYLLIRGIKALAGRPQKEVETEAYLRALADLNRQLKQRAPVAFPLQADAQDLPKSDKGRSR